MTNDELKKKIVEILCKVWIEPVPCTAERKFEHAADALIAAGIGDVSELKKHRVVVEKSLIPEDDNAYVLPNIPPTVKQLYSGEEVEQIVIERAEYKHRAEVAERALQYACKSILKDRNDTERRVRAYFNAYLERAEKELAEEKKSD